MSPASVFLALVVFSSPESLPTLSTGAKGATARSGGASNAVGRDPATGHPTLVCAPSCAGAALGRARLARATLREVDLSGADLRGADLTDADLFGVNLRGARLEGARLRGTRFSRCDLREADLRGANLGPTYREARWIDLGHGYRFTAFDSSDLSRTNFEGARLVGASFSKARLEDTRFRRADLRSACLASANLVSADLRGANLGAATFRPRFVLRPQVSHGTAQRAHEAGEDALDALRLGADLHRVPLAHVRCDRHTRWPRGFDASAAGATCER